MKNKKILLFIIVVISGLFVLSGCSSAGISLELSPNPIDFSESQDQTARDLDLTVTTTGFGSLSLDNLIVQVIDENDNDNVIFGDEKEIDVVAPVVGGISKTVSYTLDLEKIYRSANYDDDYTSFTNFYNNFLQNNSHILRITVTGSNDETLTAQINYNE